MERVEQVRKLKEINENAEQAGDLLGPNSEDPIMVAAIKQRWVSEKWTYFQHQSVIFRYQDNKEGKMNSLIFLYVKTENEELSGHIDLTSRW